MGNLTFEQAYKTKFLSLSYFARTRLFNADYAFDAVQDAFTKAVIYLKKHSKETLSDFILKREVIRACRRINKRFSYEISCPGEHFEQIYS